MTDFPTKPCAGCGEPVIWAKNSRTGAPLDLDPEPLIGGRYRLAQHSGEVWARNITPTEANGTAFGTRLHQDHLKTCARADYLRQKQRAEKRYR